MQHPINPRNSRTIFATFVTALVAASFLLTACGVIGAQPKTYTIGVVNYVPTLETVVEGFKAGMAELGYVEGQNVTYIYHGVLQNDPQVIGAEVQALMDAKVDMFFTVGTPTTLAAKTAVEGTNIPVVFAPVVNPVGEGAVASLSRPGGNVTGVQSVNNAPKALEWLVRLAPETKQVYVFYNPKDETSVLVLKPLPDAAAQVGVELVPTQVASPEEFLASMKTLPEGAAILLIPMPSLSSATAEIKKLAIELGIPTGGYNDPGDDVIFGYTTDRFSQGGQAARLADKIFKGAKPADLPVETAESFLRINVKTADTIGLHIPDEFLKEADTVLR